MDIEALAITYACFILEDAQMPISEKSVKNICSAAGISLKFPHGNSIWNRYYQEFPDLNSNLGNSLAFVSNKAPSLSPKLLRIFQRQNYQNDKNLLAFKNSFQCIANDMKCHINSDLLIDVLREILQSILSREKIPSVNFKLVSKHWMTLGLRDEYEKYLHIDTFFPLFESAMKNFDSKTYFSDCKYIGMFKDFFTYDKDLYGESYGVNYSVVYFDHFKMAMQRFWPPSIPILFSIEKVLSSGYFSHLLDLKPSNLLGNMNRGGFYLLRFSPFPFQSNYTPFIFTFIHNDVIHDVPIFQDSDFAGYFTEDFRVSKFVYSPIQCAGIVTNLIDKLLETVRKSFPHERWVPEKNCLKPQRDMTAVEMYDNYSDEGED